MTFRRSLRCALAASVAIALAWAAPAGAAQLGLDLAGRDTSIAPGDDFFAYANGDLAQDDRDPGRPIELGRGRRSWPSAWTAKWRTSSSGAAAAGPARGSEAAKVARLLRDLHGRGGDRGEGHRAAQARAGADRRHRRSTRRSRAYLGRSCAPTSTCSTPPTSTPTTCSACGSRRTSTEPTQLRALPAAGRPRHAGPRILPLGRRRGWSPSARRTRPTSPRCSAWRASPDAEAARRPSASSSWRPASPGSTRRVTDTEDVPRATTTGRAPSSTSRAPGLDWDAFLAAAGLGAQPTFVVVAARGDRRRGRAGRSRAARDLEGLPRLPRHRSQLGRAAEGLRRRALRLLRQRAVGHARSCTSAGSAGSTPPTPRSARRSASSTSPNTSRPSPRRRREAMVANLLAAFDRRIDKLDWMTPATKARPRPSCTR